jgi:hypothetical protein
MNIREANIRIKQIDNDLTLGTNEELKREKELIINWINREIDILKEYDPVKAKVIKLRQDSNMTWEKIAEATCYSKKQCYNIYNKYTKERLK